MANTITPTDEVDLSHYLDVILRRRWIVAMAVVLVLATTAFITFTTKPLYQAAALLVIEKERSASTQNGSLENSNEDYYQTQYKLLQSRTLLERVYVELKLSELSDFA
jgi:uncharacterized protein involved in exopolysaccharide biosynthesis